MSSCRRAVGPPGRRATGPSGHRAGHTRRRLHPHRNALVRVVKDNLDRGRGYGVADALLPWGDREQGRRGGRVTGVQCATRNTARHAVQRDTDALQPPQPHHLDVRRGAPFAAAHSEWDTHRTGQSGWLQACTRRRAAQRASGLECDADDKRRASDTGRRSATHPGRSCSCPSCFARRQRCSRG